MPRRPSISAEEVFDSILEAADRANVSASTIRRAIRDGQLESDASITDVTQEEVDVASAEVSRNLGW